MTERTLWSSVHIIMDMIIILTASTFIVREQLDHMDTPDVSWSYTRLTKQQKKFFKFLNFTQIEFFNSSTTMQHQSIIDKNFYNMGVEA